MTAQSKATIKSYFETGDRPTQAQFIDFIDSYADVSGVGTVASAGLVMPSIFAVAGSPITSSGNFTVTLSAQSQKQIFASPASATGAPVFRSLLYSDLPATTVSAGTYDNPSITVNDKGVITNLTTGGGTTPTYGNFTPTGAGLSVAGAPTYATQEGTYVKIGNLVNYEIHLVLTALGGMTGQFAINGLPFTVSGTLFAATVGTYANAAAGITTAPRVVAQGGTTQLRLHKDGAGSSAVLNAATDITATFDIYIAGWYTI